MPAAHLRSSEISHRRAAVLALALSAFATTAVAQPAHEREPEIVPARVALPASALSAREGAAWRVWWRSDAAPARWDAADASLARVARWRRGADGVEWAEIPLGGTGEAWRTRLVAARIDPARVALRLDTAFAARTGRPAWTADRAAPAARGDALRFAVNAGQFAHALPWGWVVLDGREWLRPGTGPLASSFVVSRDGGARLVHGDSTARPRAAWAFQSYPTLLAGGAVPEPLRGAGRGIDVEHRDARAALGVDARGRVIVALTRFDALGGRLDFVPFGLTVPEMAAVMGALGATDAVMLDGGVSAQMLLRDADGRARRWPGLRPVPLALVGTPRR